MLCQLWQCDERVQYVNKWWLSTLKSKLSKRQVAWTRIYNPLKFKYRRKLEVRSNLLTKSTVPLLSRREGMPRSPSKGSVVRLNCPEPPRAPKNFSAIDPLSPSKSEINKMEGSWLRSSLNFVLSSVLIFITYSASSGVCTYGKMPCHLWKQRRKWNCTTERWRGTNMKRRDRFSEYKFEPRENCRMREFRKDVCFRSTIYRIIDCMSEHWMVEGTSQMVINPL